MTRTKRDAGGNVHTKSFLTKPKPMQNLINDAICILRLLGVSQGKGKRQNEKTAMIFLALAGMRAGNTWNSSTNISRHALTTRNIISYINDNYGESISSGSYDDIRRKGIVALIHAGIVEESMPWAATNDSRRGYGISTNASRCIRRFGTPKWNRAVDKMLKSKHNQEQHAVETTPRNVVNVNNHAFKMSPGVHNQIQKSVIEVLLPRLCAHAQILYFGDSNKKRLVYEKDELNGLGIKVSIRGTLPDIIAYSKRKNSVYVIEAVHTSNPITDLRRAEFARMYKRCRASVTYISVFKTRKSFQKFASGIGWKTKVWLVDSPGHLISFNGEPADQGKT